jgi:hypothetical protein
VEAVQTTLAIQMLSEAGCLGRLVRIALRLRRESWMTPGYITRWLQMGTKMYLSRLRYWQGREQRNKQ